MGILADSYIAGSGFLSSQLIQDYPLAPSEAVFVKVGGAYVAINSVHVKVDGVYKSGDEIYMKQGGVYAPL